MNTKATDSTALSRAPAPRYEWLLFDADGTLFDFERAERTALAQTFEHIGAAFETVFARLGHPAKQAVLMIGDGWASDIQGAVQYGVDACWFNPGRLPRPDSPKILREVGSFQELLEWLG